MIGPDVQCLHTSIFYVTSLGRGWLGSEGLVPAKGNRTHRRRWWGLGGLFGRAVDARVGELLVQRRVHVGLEREEGSETPLPQDCLC